MAGAGFAIGLDAIAAGFKEGDPATIHWSTERSFAASSGDLGGQHRHHLAQRARRRRQAATGFPFFTVWRRDGPDKPWRYIAE